MPSDTAPSQAMRRDLSEPEETRQDQPEEMLPFFSRTDDRLRARASRYATMACVGVVGVHAPARVRVDANRDRRALGMTRAKLGDAQRGAESRDFSSLDSFAKGFASFSTVRSGTYAYQRY